MARFVLGVIVAVLLASSPASAENLTLDNLMGRWCGEGLVYTFSRTALTVDFANGANRVLEIDRVEGSATWVMIYWKPPYGNTMFTEFSKNGYEMAQAANTAGDMGPRRPFKRC